jgi:glycosidase
VLTWPTIPVVYYGDEIGMRYLENLPDVEGSVLTPTHNRSGSRTPMQWDDDPGAGFSTAPPERFYLPLDPDPARPSVAAQFADEGSLLHLVRRLVALRRATPALGPTGDIEVLHEGYPFAYVRGGTHLVVINPRQEPASVAVPRGWDDARPLEVSGVVIRDSHAEADGFGFGVFERP